VLVTSTSMVLLKRFMHLIFQPKRKSSCLNVTGTTYLLLVRAKVEDLKGTSMGLSTLMHLDCDI
jgi:hypothetical protein